MMGRVTVGHCRHAQSSGKGDAAVSSTKPQSVCHGRMRQRLHRPGAQPEDPKREIKSPQGHGMGNMGVQRCSALVEFLR